MFFSEISFSGCNKLILSNSSVQSFLFYLSPFYHSYARLDGILHEF